MKVDSALGVRIVGNGSIAGPVREGVNIPVLVVDASDMPEIGEAIDAAKYEPDGDVKTEWGEDTKNRNVLLHVTFIRPAPADFIVVFELPKFGILVDGVLEAGAFYLKAGKPGDNFKSTFADPSILVDVPKGEFDEMWPARYKASMMDEFRRNGMGIKEARRAAEQTYEGIRGTTTFRMPQQ